MVAAGPIPEGRGTRILVWVALASALLIDAAYVAIIATQGSQSPDVFTVPFVAGYIVLAAVLLGVSLIDRPLAIKVRPALRAAAGFGLIALGVLALFSIGLPLIVAGALATAAASQAISRSPRLRTIVSAVLAAFVAMAVLAVGFSVTSRWIVCPATGSMGGSGGGIFAGSFTYDCNGGQLTIKST